MESYNASQIDDTINIGSDTDSTISSIAEKIKQVTGYNGEILHDFSKPDGTPQKLLDTSKINDLGWKASTPLIYGIKNTYEGLK